MIPSMPSFQELQDLREKARFTSLEFSLPLGVSQLWPHLSNTDLMNQNLDMSIPTYTFHQQADSRPLMAVTTKMAGMNQSYLELPYQWEAKKHLRVERIFDKGLFHYLSYGLKLEPRSEQQCQVTVFFYYISKVPDLISKPVLKANLNKIKEIFIAISKQLPQAKANVPAAGYMQPEEKHQQEIEALTKRWQVLMPESAIPGAVASYIYCAPERYVHHLRSNEVALYYGLAPQDVLRFCLLASKENWLIPRWAMLCTSCWGAKNETTEMKQVVNNYYCESCDHDYAMNMGSNLELVFAPIKALRHTQDNSFCAGSPANTPQICAQTLMWPNQTQTQTLKLNHPAGAYRLWVDSTPIELNLSQPAESENEQQEPTTLNLEHVPEHLTLPIHSELQVSPAKALKILRLEDLTFHQHIVTASQLYALQEYNELFVDQIPGVGVKFAANHQTFLSIDTHFSTEISNWIQDELKELIGWTCREQLGALVQTDSKQYLNYLFADLSHAFTSSEKILEHFHEMQALYSDTSMGLSLMLYQSPCEIFSRDEQVCFNIADFQPDQSLMAKDHGLLLVEPEVFASETMQTWIENLNQVQAEVLEDDPLSPWVRIRLIHLHNLIKQRPERTYTSFISP